MTEFDKDFVNQKGTDVEIDGRKFVIREMLGDEYDKYSTEFMSYLKNESTGEVKVTMDWSARSAIFLRKCVIDAPYDSNGKPFKSLNEEERFKLLNSLKVGIRQKLLDEVRKVNELGDDEQKK